MRIRKIGLFLGLGIFTAVALAPTPDGLSEIGKMAAATTLLMACWWITEAIPIAATSFVPLVLFPLTGVLNAKDTAANFGQSFVLLFLCSFIIARAIEHNGLHRRIALSIIRRIGTSRKRVLASCMIATAGLSMWLSNMAVSLMMLPIGVALLSRDEGKGSDSFATALVLSIAYAATIGGVATLVGTPPNLVFAGMMKELFPAAPEITFVKWLTFGLPLAGLFLPVAWWYLVKFFKVRGELGGSGESIEAQYQALGPITTAEKRVAWVGILTVVGWILRKDLVIGSFTLPGWSGLLGVSGMVDDGTVAALGMILLFIIPSGEPAEAGKNAPRLMNWTIAQTIPWGVAMIVGGGYCIANGFRSSGLTPWLGDQMGVISQFPVFLLVLSVVVGLSFLTEINSNTATSNIFLPVLATMAIAGETNPLLLMIPGTIACSCAFMLPAGTGPNSVIFASGRINIPTMASCGFWLNMIGVVLMTLAMYLIAIPVFDIVNALPEWAQ
ncbi:MAG: SLC13 family permease [Synoicihabitans sp.]